MVISSEVLLLLMCEHDLSLNKTMLCLNNQMDILRLIVCICLLYLINIHKLY